MRAERAEWANAYAHEARCDCGMFEFHVTNGSRSSGFWTLRIVSDSTFSSCSEK